MEDLNKEFPMEDQEAMDLENEYPSIPMAYELAIRSYDWSLRRWDSVNTLFTGLVAMAVPLTLALPVLSHTFGVAIDSWWLIVIGVLFVAVLTCCVVGRLFGDTTLIDPRILFDGHLGSSPLEFQKDLIYYAGVHFDHNSEVINRKWWWARSAAVLLTVEVAGAFCVVVL